MTARKPIPDDIVQRVLDRSRRRCALCFHFNNDSHQKEGQLAHLDRDPSNFAEDNLAFLCLPHHDNYDTKRRQTKNLTIGEVKTARRRLYEFIEMGSDLGSGPTAHAAEREFGYKRRVEMLSKLSQHLSDARDFFQSVVRCARFEGDLPVAEYQNRCRDALASAQETLAQGRIFVPVDFANHCEQFFVKISQGLVDYDIAQDPMVVNGLQRAGFWDKAATTAHDELPGSWRGSRKWPVTS